VDVSRSCRPPLSNCLDLSISSVPAKDADGLPSTATNFNAATAASFNPQNRICKEIALQRPEAGKFDYSSAPNHPSRSTASEFFTDD
jgi:hypothetical protein